jgi:hypothetical protein
MVENKTSVGLGVNELLLKAVAVIKEPSKGLHTATTGQLQHFSPLLIIQRLVSLFPVKSRL